MDHRARPHALPTHRYRYRCSPRRSYCPRLVVILDGSLPQPPPSLTHPLTHPLARSLTHLGHLVILDGVHRLSAGLLSSAVARLLADRQVDLPDGARIVAPSTFAALLAAHDGNADALRAANIYCCHPAFAAVAIAEPVPPPPKRSWLAEDILPMFHFHSIGAMGDAEHMELLSRPQTAEAARARQCAGQPEVTVVPERMLRGLLQCAAALREAARADSTLHPLRLSTRRLVRVARHLAAAAAAASPADRTEPSDRRGMSAGPPSDDALRAALARELGATLSLMPPSTQQAVDEMTRRVLRRAGLADGSLLPQRQHADEGELGVGRPDSGGDGLGGGGGRERSGDAHAKARLLKQLEKQAVDLRTAAMWGHANAMGEASLDRSVGAMRQDEARESDSKERQRRDKAMRLARAGPGGASTQLSHGRVLISGGQLRIDDVEVAIRSPHAPSLVPRSPFFEVSRHVDVLREMLRDWSLGNHLLLIGNQGVGKNKLADRLLELLSAEREYVQLHRDTTVQSLTLAPTVEDGKVIWRDSPLVRAVRHGRVLMVDEADKAPLEVVCVLKALAEDGELTLGDGRRLLAADVCDARAAAEGAPTKRPTQASTAGGGASSATSPDLVVRIHPDFRMVVLANRPGFPFLGNDFFHECGDVFAASVVDALDLPSELQLLRSYAPNAPVAPIVDLCLLFAELRQLSDAGTLSYPYSTRELVKLAQHYERFPEDGIDGACANVFTFDAFDGRMRTVLAEVLARHGVDATVAFSHTPLKVGATFGLSNEELASSAAIHDGKKVLPDQFKSAKHHASGEFASGRSKYGNVGTRTYDDAEDRSGKINRP